MAEKKPAPKKKGRPKKIKLGDKVEDILKATGIKGLVELVNGGKCEKCEKRKERLNRLFETIQYNEVKGKATPEQIASIKAIGLDKNKYSEEEADLLEGIYNQIHHTNVIICRSCGRSAKEWKAVFVRLQKAMENVESTN